ncbi:TonB-dependent siderophore receptor [uncultured Microscilla sp.]|uniref:TonB-dependent receptor plug domain-containing protein n=1 Tax=uncultured Microscilla sp. TaxID=432653 RepID=UPI00260DF599|nr:TonB-dependent receptor [uncultured Microscilla sp.]
MRQICALLCSLLLLASNDQLLAQDPDNLFKESLEELMKQPVAKSLFDVKITTASLNEELSGKALAMTRVITAEQIRLRNYQSLRDVLMDLPDFKVDDINDENSFNTFITRGIVGQEKFVILLDGVRISSPTNERMPIAENYPVYFAKQIEIVYGSASALYGADAVAGVINIITKTSAKNFEVEFAPSMGNYNTYNGDLFLYKKIGKASLTLAGKYFQEQTPDLNERTTDDPVFDLSGYNTGTFNTVFGTITPTVPVSPTLEAPRKAYAVFGSLKMEDFQFNMFYNYLQHSSSIQVTPNNSIYNKDVLYGQGVLMSSINYTKKLRNLRLSSSLMGSIYEMDPRTNFRNVFVGMATGYKYALGNEIKLNQTVNWQINRNLNVVGGFTFEFFNSIPKTADLSDPINPRQGIQGTITGTDLPAEFFQVNYSNIGGFAQIQYAPNQVFSFTLGSRYDNNSRFGTTLNPRMGVVVQASKKLALRLMYGSSFLAPSPLRTFEHYGSFFSNDGGQTYQSFFWHLPNPDLKPIQAKNLDFGARYFITDAFSVSINSYYTWLTDLFNDKSDADHTNIYNGQFLGWNVDFIEVPVNEGQQQNYGGSLQLDYRKEMKNTKLNAYFIVSYVDGRVDVLGDGNKAEIELVAPWQIKTGIDFSYKSFSVSPRLVWVGEQRMNAFQADNPTKRQTLDGYALLNVSLRYQLYKKSGIFINVFNALNQKYRVSNFSGNKDNPSHAFFGAPQLPLRIQGGLQVNL